MLTDDEKQRIREEESFRQEARRQLDAEQPSPPLRKRIWGIVNSALVVWFLSSIVLGLFGWAYSNYQEYVHRQEIKRRPHTEIANRGTELLLALGAVRANIDRGEPARPGTIYLTFVEMLDGHDVTTKSRIKSTHPDYQERGFQSLIVELQGLGTADEKKRLADVSDVYFMIKLDATSARDFQADDDLAQRITKSREALEMARGFLDGMVLTLSQLSGQLAPPRRPPGTAPGPPAGKQP